MTTKYIEAKARYVQTSLSRFEVTDQYVCIDAGRLADDIDRVELRGDGDGNAYHDGYGRGCARRTGKGKGKAREMRQLRAEFANPLRARRPT